MKQVILLEAAFYIVAGPLYFAGISLQIHHVLAGFTALEPQYGAVLTNVHLSSTRFNFFATECANTSLRHFIDLRVYVLHDQYL
jgi:hypothetical protein